MHELHRTFARCSLILSVGLTPLACGEDSPDTTACLDTWDASYAKRFLAGETFFLPQIQSRPSCQGLRWDLQSGPTGAQNEVEQGAGFARLTPDVVGAYRFGLSRDGQATGDSLELDVIEPLERPFHNYNYFPSPTAAVFVESELWVAGVYTPEVARFDAVTREALESIQVGQWPVALAVAAEESLVLVANKASDTLGLIDLTSNRQVDAIWVGDEPSEVVWDPTRRRAYVSLAGAGAVAVVDIATRRRVATVDAVFDPLALAMSPDASTLVVASHRSGQSDHYPYGKRDVKTERDLALIDLDELELTGHVLEVASTIHAMRFDPEGALWLTATRNEIEGGLNDEDVPSFQHELFSLKLESGLAQREASVDLSRQKTSSGSTATIHGFASCGDSWWVAAEGSDAAVELATDLTEKRRVSVAGRPRALTCGQDATWVVSSNRMEVTRIAGEEVDTYGLALTDRRDQLLREGLEFFAGQGDTTADNRSCNNCHVDGLSDAVIWNAGPVANRKLTRPFRWLEGTSPIGWDGYVGSVKISGYVGGATINRRLDSQEADGMGAYLASVMPAPPANSATRRDGSLSVEARAGKTLFEGTAGCVSCHAGPLFTNQQVMEEGFTPGRTDVPSLVDVARVGSWYKTGAMATLREVVVDTAAKTNAVLTESETDQLTRYLQELTGRDFFVLHADLGPSAEAFAVDGSIRLTFSFPVRDEPGNLAKLSLRASDGEAVAVSITVEGRHVVLQPEKELAQETSYTVRVAEGFEADDARAMTAESSFSIETATAPGLKFEGEYVVKVQVPMLDFVNGVFDYDNLVEQTAEISASPTAGGAKLKIDFGGGVVYEDDVVVDGMTLISRDLPMAVGPSFLNASPIVAKVNDDDEDGVIDWLEASVVMTGPGVDLPDIDLRIEPAKAPGECTPGKEGPAAPTVTSRGDKVTIDWGEAGALALFVATPDAVLPLGPGTAEGGETYWALSAADFPTTFNGPVEYGVIPAGAQEDSVMNGAPLGGAPLESGKCYRFSVVVDFAYSHTTMIWP